MIVITNNRDLIVVKRSGQRVMFNGTKIAIAIKSAFDDLYKTYDEKNVNFIYNEVINHIDNEYNNRKTINVEDIQDIIEKKLYENNFLEVYDDFKNYRQRRKVSREIYQNKEQHKFIKVIEQIDNSIQNNKEKKVIDSIIDYGKIIGNEYTRSYIFDSKYIRKHDDGTLYIHNLDTLGYGAIESYHIDLTTIKENNLYKYTAKIINILLNIKKDVSGIINVPNIDNLYKDVYIKHFVNTLKDILNNYLILEGFDEYINFKKIEDILDKIETADINETIFNSIFQSDKLLYIAKMAIKNTKEKTNIALNDSINSLFTKLNNCNNNTLKSTLYSISLSSDNIYEQLIIKECIYNYISEKEYLDNVGIIIRVRNNSDIEKITQIYNKNIYFINSNNKDIEYFLNGDYVYENFWQINNSIRKMVNNKVTINLPRIGIISKNEDEYFNLLAEEMDTCKNILMQGFEYIASKYKDNYECLFNNEIFTNIDLEDNQKIRKIIKNGSLSLGFIGLYESVVAHKKRFDKNFALRVLKYMKEKCDNYTNEEKLNFTLNAENNQKILKELIKADKAVYGSILNVTDKEKYNEGLYAEDEDIEYYEKACKLVKSGHIHCLVISKKSSNKKIVESINAIKNSNIPFWKIEVTK